MFNMNTPSIATMKNLIASKFCDVNVQNPISIIIKTYTADIAYFNKIVTTTAPKSLN